MHRALKNQTRILFPITLNIFYNKYVKMFQNMYKKKLLKKTKTCFNIILNVYPICVNKQIDN